jgi:hypothetical protein
MMTTLPAFSMGTFNSRHRGILAFGLGLGRTVLQPVLSGLRRIVIPYEDRAMIVPRRPRCDS